MGQAISMIMMIRMGFQHRIVSLKSCPGNLFISLVNADLSVRLQNDYLLGQVARPESVGCFF